MEEHHEAIRLSCKCGREVEFTMDDLVEDDKGEYGGSIWQRACACGRCYTIEVADDPQHPQRR